MIEETWLIPYIEIAAEHGGIALDIGANTGSVARLLATKFDGVLAVEPDHRAFAELLSSAPPNVFCHNAAAAAKNGAVELLLRPSHLQSSLLEVHPIGAGDQAEAPVVERRGVNANTLDFLLFVAKQRFGDVPVTFVKIDVEGFEGEVLSGATDPVFRSIRWLVEVHDRRVEVGEQFQRLGYEHIELIKHPYPNVHPEHFWVYVEPESAE